MGLWGNQNIGAYFESIEDVLAACSFVCTVTGPANFIKAYITPALGYSQYCKCAIYTDNNGYPGNLLGQTEETLVEGGTDWFYFYFSAPKPDVVAGNTYWLVAWGPSATGTAKVKTQGGTPYAYTKSYTYGPNFPDPFPSEGTWTPGNFSMMCDSNPPPPPPLTRRFTENLVVPTR